MSHFGHAPRESFLELLTAFISLPPSSSSAFESKHQFSLLHFTKWASKSFYFCISAIFLPCDTSVCFPHFLLCFVLLRVSPWLTTQNVLGCQGVHSACWLAFGRVSAKKKRASHFWTPTVLCLCSSLALRFCYCQGLQRTRPSGTECFQILCHFFKIQPLIIKLHWESITHRIRFSHVLLT